MPEHLKPSRIVGILGGMGPAATVDFYDKLVKATPAATDQDHLRVVIWADPTIPNRHEALLEGGEDPSPWLENGISRLIESGAEILVVACNTAHAFLDPIVAGKDIEFISIIDATVRAAVAEAERAGQPQGERRVGLLAADGAMKAGLYQDSLLAAGIEPVVPSEELQAELMEVIYGVKAGDLGPRQLERLTALIDGLVERGVTAVIAGCTEVSTLVPLLATEVTIIDPSEVLAAETIRAARRPLPLSAKPVPS